MAYSQGGEENAILHCVCDKGYPTNFLDIGAFDGVKYSNTRALALAGWRGVLVEPCPRNFYALRENCKDLAGLQFVNAALGHEMRLIEFVDSGDEYARKSTQYGQSPIFVMELTWKHLLDTFPGPWTVVSIDTEGTSASLFMSMPIEAMSPRVICVEHDNRATELAVYGEKYGYQVACLNQENIVLWK